MTSETIVDLYVRSVASFGEVLAQVPIDSWDTPTPCPDWTIQTLVVHVVSGEVQLMNLIESETYASPELSPNVLGPDPMSTWRGTAINAI
ncbi:MAG: maleylpyruvate isomerase N-terminal domain-containing protein, partial [Acidimicrobiales bacterium]|nr:maleylpyruvate isomerase N-terminal domain-containing protein [Acidimicrobiales bacterium]